MIKLIFLQALVVFSFAFQAQAETASLKQNMKAIDKIVKEMKLTIMDRNQNANNAQQAALILPLFKATQAQVPPALEDIPEAHRPAAVKAYQDMIQQEIDLVTQLQAAFLNNDNAQASAILKKMLDLKSDGHDQFDP